MVKQKIKKFYLLEILLIEVMTIKILDPIYSVDYPFAIVSEDVTLISVKAPQVNIGVGVEYSDEFMANFTDFSITVSSPTGRQQAWQVMWQTFIF